MGTLGYDPLRIYQLKRRSGDSQPIAVPSNDPDPETGHSEPVPICPPPDKPENKFTSACPQAQPAAASPPAREPVPGRAPDSAQVESPEASQINAEPSSVQPDTDPSSGNVKYEPADPSASPKPGNRGTRNNAENEQSPASSICVKKSQSRRVTIKQEKLDDDYDVF